MSTTLSIVDSPGAAVLFAFNDADGSENPYGVGVQFGRDFELDMGTFEPEYVINELETGGAQVLRTRHSLMQVRFIMKVTATTAQEIIDCLGYAGRLLAEGGRYLKYQPTATSDTYYIPFEPSPELQIFSAQPLELHFVGQSPVMLPDIGVRINRQPYAEGAELDPAVNLLTNATLLLEGATAGRPLGWTLDDSTGITAESIDATEQAYTFTIANADAHNWQQSTGAATAAPNDVWTGSLHAKVASGAAKARVVLRYLDSGGTPLGTDQADALTTLSTSWQRLDVTTSAAPASTDRVRISLQVDNDDATSVQVYFRNAQLEEAAEVSTFRAGAESVSNDPTSTSYAARAFCVWCQGDAPSLARVRVTSDAVGLRGFYLSRETVDPINLLAASLIKQMEDGTLGTGAASTADTEGTGDDVMEVTYSASDPVLRADNFSGGTGQTITVTKPTGTAEGDLLVAYIFRWDTTTIIAPPAGWKKAFPTLKQTTGNFILEAYYKIATAADAAAGTTSYVWTVLYDAAGNRSYRAWVGAYQNVNTDVPLDTYSTATENAATAITAATLTTTAASDLIVGAAAGEAASGSLSWTKPTGTTPTTTEQDDGTSDQTFRGMEVWDGVLAAAGATGTKDATASITVDGAHAMLAFFAAASTFVERWRDSWTALPEGSYDVVMRMAPTAASRQRLRLEWGLGASPSVWTSLGDYVPDWTGVAASTYVERRMGRVYVPPESNGTVTIRLYAGLEETSSAKLRGDFVALVPCNERVGLARAPVQLGTGEDLVSEGETSRIYALDSSDVLLGVGTAEGAIPVELEPGLNAFWARFVLDTPTGYIDPASDLDASPTIAVTQTPRYRV